MNWLVFAVLAWLFLGLELGLKDALQIGPLGIAPSFVLVLLTVVAMSARPIHALWGAFLLGVLLDLTNAVPSKDAGPVLTIIGPGALGCPLAAHLIISLRALMIRRNPLTVGFLSAVSGLVTSVVFVAVFSLRSRLDPIPWNATEALVVHASSALYTGLVGIPVALVLLPAAPLLGMPTHPQRRTGRWA